MSMTMADTEMQRETRGPSLLIWVSAAAVLSFLVWASFASVDTIVRGQGEIVPASRPQIIQSLEGGILSELAVREGDLVGAGALLGRLHDTQIRAGVDETEKQLLTLHARQLRLEAEMQETGALDFPDTLLQRVPEIAASERALLTARLSDFKTRREGLQAVLTQAEEEAALMETMRARKLVAPIEVTRAQKAASDARVRYREVISQMELKRSQEYAETLAEIASLVQTLKARRDQLTRTALKAPIDGVVNKISVTTIGGVIRPGEEILQIIPVDEELLIEAQVSPKDIAHIHPGQQATIKLSAYDYTIYGTLRARVDLVSADTFKNERDPDSEPHYLVRLQVVEGALTDRQRDLTIRPGMQATVELDAGRRTIMDYLLKPLYRSSEALNEA